MWQQQLLLLHLLLAMVCLWQGLGEESIEAANSNSGAGGVSCDDPQRCGNSPFNISSPFGVKQDCVRSKDFLMECNTSNFLLQWIGFSFTSSQQDLHPYVMDISPSSSSSSSSSSAAFRYINLTWNLTVLTSASNAIETCTRLPYAKLPQYLPNFTSGIQLKGFADGTFRFSNRTLILLFNCTKPLTSSNAKSCSDLHLECDHTKLLFDPSNCAQLQLTTDLDLNKTMMDGNCSHFQMMVTSTPEDDANQMHAKVGMIQLAWNDPQLPSSTSSSKSKERCDTGCIVGVSLASVVLLIIGITILVCFCRRRRRRQRFAFARGIPRPSSSMSNPSDHNKLRTHRALTLSSRLGPVPTGEFDYKELLEATDGFAEKNMIGDGGFGAVYLGILRDGRKVAIKRLYHDNFRKMDQFYNEIKVLSSFRHPHLVQLYGFCCEDERDLLLVFEYASKGTVWDHLHHKGHHTSSSSSTSTSTPTSTPTSTSTSTSSSSSSSSSSASQLPWELRLNIACETAEALAYLHNDLDPPIYHRDVKTTNILLDDGFGVKLADFGLSRLVPVNVSHITTVPQGSPGYVDPDYHQSYQLTDKSDVYSFGVVLVELVSAKLAVDMSRSRGEINLSYLALAKISRGAWEDLIDPSLRSGPAMAGFERSAKAVLELAFTCLQEEKDDRPAMKEVAETLILIRRQFELESNIGGANSVDEEASLDQKIVERLLSQSSTKSC